MTIRPTKDLCRVTFVSVCLCGVLASIGGCASSPPQHEPTNPRRALGIHSHNDYTRARPLLDALDAGCRSIEVDIWYVNGTLLVGHDEEDLTPDRTLDAMYLAPLAAHIREHNGYVYTDQPEDEPVILLIDIKSDGPSTLPPLTDLLQAYESMLTIVENSETRWGPVQIILSGDRPTAMVEALPRRLLAIDGRPIDLDRNPPATLIPLVSEKWESLFTWNGRGPLPEAERDAVRTYTERAHAQHRLVRFWATPDTPDSWRTLRELGVDLINTDRPQSCAESLAAHQHTDEPASRTQHD